MSPKQIFVSVLSGVILIVALWVVFSTYENLDASQIMVIQSPLSGTLTWHTQPGVKWKFFGKATKYQKRSQFWFSAKNDQGKTADESIRIRFNDGGHAQISGGISWELPLDNEHLTDIHTKFGSQAAVEQQLVRTMVEKSIYMTGPIMSSKESYAERRNDLLHLIEDQVQNGVYLTKTTSEKVKDPVTGEEKTVAKVELVIMAEKGSATARAEESPLKEFGIKVFNLAINEIKYEDSVEAQIQAQQQAVMQVQLAMAKSKEAEQEALTTKKQGEAAAAKAEWEQKTIAAKSEQEAKMKKTIAETEAEMKLEVAKLALETAEQTKLAAIAIGEGEAKARQLVLEADGALEKKLEAYVQVNQAYADAIAQHAGNWVPTVIMGGAAGGNGSGKGLNGASDLIDLLTVKAAKDLSLDMAVTNAQPKPITVTPVVPRQPRNKPIKPLTKSGENHVSSN